MGEVFKKAPIVLVVEDDPDVRGLAVALLEETELDVVPCDNAEDAFATLCGRGDEIALVFVDIRLTGPMDGVDLAWRVRRLWPRIRIIVTSGNPGSRVGALPDNVLYMPKPWLPLDLLVQAEHASAAMQAAR